jgi:hypothetical protein
MPRSTRPQRDARTESIVQHATAATSLPGRTHKIRFVYQAFATDGNFRVADRPGIEFRIGPMSSIDALLPAQDSMIEFSDELPDLMPGNSESRSRRKLQDPTRLD